MTNNQLEKIIFVIYKRDQKSNYPTSQRAITNQNSIKKLSEGYEKKHSGVVCVVNEGRRFTNACKDIRKEEN